MAVGSIVCLINRAPWPLGVTKDGKQTPLQPGENYVNSDLVRFAKAQNPLPGSQDPYTLLEESLVGVKGSADPVDPIPADILKALPAEKLDRTKLPLDRQRGAHEVETRFPRGRSGAALEQATDSFVNYPGAGPGGD